MPPDLDFTRPLLRLEFRLSRYGSLTLWPVRHWSKMLFPLVVWSAFCSPSISCLKNILSSMSSLSSRQAWSSQYKSGCLSLRFGNRKQEDQIQKFKVGCVLSFDTMVNRDVFRDRQIIVPNQVTCAMTGSNGADI